MYLNNILLINYRNYNKLKINLDKKINIFLGENGQGKTNILESIYLLAITKTHRYGNEHNLIKHGEQTSKVTGRLRKGKIITDLEVILEENSKKVIINNNPVKKISDYISNLNIIIFSPEDLNIIKGSPNVRRNLLNIQLSQLYPDYLKTLNEYNKILKIRNEYLKIIKNRKMDDNYFDILTEKLINRSIIIYKYRYEYLNSINDQISFIYKDIFGEEDLKININWSFSYEEIISREIISLMKKRYKEVKSREINNKMTLIGPHREDFEFEFKDKNLKVYGSQGQQRLAIIAYKLSEINIFYNKTGRYPILLLDDILSEIDKKRKNKLLNYLSEDIQTIITTTDLNDINKKFRDKAKIFYIKNNNVIERGRK